MNSTTHGSETLGLRATIEVINFYKKNNVIKHNHHIGEKLYLKCYSILKEENFEKFMTIIPNYWMLIFEFKNKDKSLIPYLQTSFSQEMILNGVLIQSSFIPCYSHDDRAIDVFCRTFQCTIKTIKNQLLNEEILRSIKPVKRVFRKYI